MNKTLTSLLVLGTSAVLLVPTTGSAWAHRGDDDSSQSSDDGSGRDRDHSTDDNSTPGDDDGTADQGRGDNGSDDSPSDDSGRDDSGRDDSRDDNGDDSRGRDRDRRDKSRVEVRRSGECSVASQWRIRIKVREDRARIKFQVDSNVVGEEWTYSVSDNGTEVLSGSRRTHAPSGDFTVQRKWRGGQSGSHSVTATATNPQTGETCEGSAAA